MDKKFAKIVNVFTKAVTKLDKLIAQINTKVDVNNEVIADLRDANIELSEVAFQAARTRLKISGLTR
ncbi:MAG: hypothetical protein KAJ19_14295 [Gammaproteobacteria bacterium]|nr:hypothetical protein [Gammaproteobacteria bacterium]